MKYAGALGAALIVSIAVDAHAQLGRVAGTVSDGDGRPLKGATITAENRDQSPSTLTSSSDARGRFSILGMRPGIWIFTIHSPGFETAAHRREVATTRPNPSLHVQLLRGSVPAPPGPLVGIDGKEIQRRIDAAETLENAGEHSAALARYRDLLARVPALTSIYLRIGAINEQAGDSTAAIDAYNRLLELEPDNARAQSALKRLGR